MLPERDLEQGFQWGAGAGGGAVELRDLVIGAVGMKIHNGGAEGGEKNGLSLGEPAASVQDGDAYDLAFFVANEDVLVG